MIWPSSPLSRRVDLSGIHPGSRLRSFGSATSITDAWSLETCATQSVRTPWSSQYSSSSAGGGFKNRLMRCKRKNTTPVSTMRTSIQHNRKLGELTISHVAYRWLFLLPPTRYNWSGNHLMRLISGVGN
ncbi:hypothetical protein PM082_022959 [Marasmius tenuissimus]|nr:hypothetical protein PM082_022959 [Marasmius tenuissimus]